MHRTLATTAVLLGCASAASAQTWSYPLPPRATFLHTNFAVPQQV